MAVVVSIERGHNGLSIVDKALLVDAIHAISQGRRSLLRHGHWCAAASWLLLLLSLLDLYCSPLLL